MNSLKETAWAAGIIAALYLRDDQKEVYLHLFKHKNPFIESARRYGKTTTILCYVLEKLRQNPGWVCRWCEPNKNQAREIILPELDKIQADCPKQFRFEWQTTDSVAIGPGNSRLYLRGINEDRGDSARGPFAHILVADEFGSWRDPEYIVNEALRPQILTTRGQFIFASTPPRDLGHAYYEHKDRALRENRFIQRVIHDNASLSHSQIDEACSEVGGKESAAWRREYLCEPVSDPDSLVIPEYKEEIHDIEDDTPRPQFCDKYVGVDLGFSDCSAFLFAYFDFLNQELVIEDENVVAGKNSEELSNEAKKKEAGLWPDDKVYLRVADNDLQQIHDMTSIYKYNLSPTRKDDKLAAISHLRVRFQQGKIKIKKQCKNLRYQLKVGMWNERKTDFQRSERTGHLDAIAALIYLNRNIVTTHNPFPQYLGMSIHTHHVPPKSLGQNKDMETLKRSLRLTG